jgi:NADH-quinone oxidoreductase subunit N
MLHVLVVIGVINSAISWYYYLRIVVAMFFAEPAQEFKAPAVARSLAAGLILAILGTLYLGIMPGRVLDALESAGAKTAAMQKK